MQQLMINKIKNIYILFLFCLGVLNVQAKVIYVSPNGSGSQNGTSWNNAKAGLQAGIDAAIVGDEIWVQKGTYYPTKDRSGNASPADSREKTFYITKDNIKIYGVFFGNETLLSQRNYETNVTLLSGDLAGDDPTLLVSANNPFPNVSDNVYHIVFIHRAGAVAANSLTAALVLDGFTIKGGNADALSGVNSIGAGIYNSSSSGISSPTISNCTIWLNKAYVGGGGMYNNGSGNASPTLTNCSFVGNHATLSGAALYNAGYLGTANPIIDKCSFIGNKSQTGGIYNRAQNGTANPVITNSTFVLNEANSIGSVMYNHTVNASSTISLTFMNCTFANNTSTQNHGGTVLYNHSFAAGLINTSFTNCILWNNGLNPIFGNTTTGTTINYSIYHDQTVDGTVVLPAAVGVTGANNLDADPLFINTNAANFNIEHNSPAVNAGTSVNAPTYDILNTPRPSRNGYDMGAYENKLPLVYVNVNATGGNNGTSWANAYTDLQTALTNTIYGAEIWVAAGTYYPTYQEGADSRNKFFHIIKDETEVYGGFVGGETALSERNPTTNITILSGDIGVKNTNTDNSYHVVYINGTTANGSITTNTILDGFTISDGNATNSFAGGILLNAGLAGKICNPIISNCIITNNYALNGSAIYNLSSNGGEASPTIKNCVIKSNSSSSGTFYNYTRGTGSKGNPSFINCLMVNNNCAGGIYNVSDGGGSISEPTFTNCTFSGNLAGAPFLPSLLYNTESGSKVTMTNCILWANGLNYPQTDNGAQTIINNCIYDDGTIDGTVALYYGSSGSNNLDSDPLFTDAANGDYTLQSTSPAIDIGNNSANTQTLDLAGVTRKSNTTIDLGAYEYQNPVVLPVELLSFYGVQEDENVRLYWKTATEINNDYFDVEYSTNGIDFEKIGKILGAGNSTSIQYYDFLHETVTASENYYRLKQVDLPAGQAGLPTGQAGFDGKFEYTNTINITIQSSNNKVISIYPNPATGNFVNIDTQNQSAYISLHDNAGRVVRNYESTNEITQLDISNLPSGLYYITIMKNGIQAVEKLIIE